MRWSEVGGIEVGGIEAGGIEVRGIEVGGIEAGEIEMNRTQGVPKKLLIGCQKNLGISDSRSSFKLKSPCRI